MRLSLERSIAMLACACVVAVFAGPAAADPTQAPGATSATFVCGGVPVPLTLLPNGAAAFTSSTSVGIAVGHDGEVIPGFDHNAVATVDCTGMFNGQLVTVTALFTPPSAG